MVWAGAGCKHSPDSSEPEFSLEKEKDQTKEACRKGLPSAATGSVLGAGGGRGLSPGSLISSSVKRIQRKNSVVETKTRTDVAITGGWWGGGWGGVCPSRGKGSPSQKRTQSPSQGVWGAQTMGSGPRTCWYNTSPPVAEHLTHAVTFPVSDAPLPTSVVSQTPHPTPTRQG